MMALGDQMFEYRTGAVIIPVVVIPVVLVLWFFRRPLSSIYYIIGLSLTGFAIALTYLPRVESNYKVTYRLKDQEHSIPWVYGPFSSYQSEIKFITVRVWGEDLAPYYGKGPHPRNYITLNKSVDFNAGKGGPPPEYNCLPDRYRFSCEWQKGEFVYGISVSAESTPSDPKSLFRPIENLLDSFVVGGK